MYYVRSVMQIWNVSVKCAVGYYAYSAMFCVGCSLVMYIVNAKGDHIVEIYTSIDLVTDL